jgi:hypothetical protein
MATSKKNMNDYEFLANQEQMSEVLRTKHDDYGVSEAESSDLSGKVTAYSGGLTAHVNADAKALAATESKNLFKKVLAKFSSDLTEKIRVYPGMTDDKLREAGITVYDKVHSVLTPLIPTEFMAVFKNDDEVHSKWNRGDNKQGCLYVVECQMGDDPEFKEITTITATKYVHHNFPAGTKATYRVRAKRGNELSNHSNEATVFAD